MKKLALILGSLLMAASVSAKEVVTAPVQVEEVMVEEAPVVVATPSKNRLVVGAEFVSSEKLFKQEDDNMTVMPNLDITYGKFYIKGMQIGVKAYENDMMALSIFVDPIAGFPIEGGDMKDGYENIDDRDAMAMFGGKIDIKNMPMGIIPTISYKVGEEGGQGDIVIARPTLVGEKFVVTPSVMWAVYSGDMADYYFGVDEKEANRSTSDKLEEYSADTSYMLGAKLACEYLFTENVSFTANAGVKQYSGDIKDSPIVENDVIMFVGAGAKYKF